MVTIMETLADYAGYTKDPEILTEYVRQALARQITRQFVADGDSLKVVTVGPALEKKLAESVQQTDQGSYLALDPNSSQLIYSKLSEQLTKLIQAGQQPVILTSPTVRMYLRQLLERTMQDIPVLSYSELEPTSKFKAWEW